MRKLILSMLFVCPVWAQAQCVEITSLPQTISVGGCYFFGGDLDYASVSGVAVSITTGSVTLDLNGHRLGMAAAGVSTTAVGIQVASDKKNVTIKNGLIRGAYKAVEAISTGSASGIVVENLTVDLARYVGVEVAGNGVVVRNNLILNTGGSTVSTPATAISVSGSAVVAGNIISVADNGVVFASGGGKYTNNLTLAVVVPFTGGTDAGGNN